MKIAVLVGGIAYETQRRLLEGIVRYTDEENVKIFVFTCNGDIYRQAEYGIGEFQILFCRILHSMMELFLQEIPYRMSGLPLKLHSGSGIRKHLS